MPKIEKIRNRGTGLVGILPLRLTRRAYRKTGEHSSVSASIRVKCGCCNEAVVISHEHEPTGNTHVDILEINGVMGTVDQWRQVLLPLLQIQEPVLSELKTVYPATSFRMIRAGAGYHPVILVTPADAHGNNVPGARYYEYNRDKSTEGWGPDQFNEIDCEEAQLAFCGQADGWGFAELREEPFVSLDDALAFVLEKQ